MIKSMTGFGVATIDKPSENINLEINLNSKPRYTIFWPKY